MATALSKRIKKRFVKDMMLPVQVLEEPYFSEAIKTIDPHFQSIEKLKLLTDLVTLVGEDHFFELSKKLEQDVIYAIQSTDGYKSWIKSENVANVYKNKGISKTSVYSPQNEDSMFVSVDIVSANFTSLCAISREITLGYDTYPEMIASFTEHEYFRRSKHIRQVIFGSLSPGRQQTLWRKTMDTIVTVLREDANVSLDEIVTLSNDEVILTLGPVDQKTVNDEYIASVVDTIQKTLKNNEMTRLISERVKVDAFILRTVKGCDKKFYVKEHVYPRVGHLEFKTIPCYFFIQVYKHYTKQPILKDDLVFYLDGQLATFNTSLFLV